MKPTLPLTFGETVITGLKPSAIYYKVRFVDADGIVWEVSDAHFLYDMQMIGAYYVGVRDDVNNPGIVAGPFGVPPTSSIPSGKFLFLREPDGFRLISPYQGTT